MKLLILFLPRLFIVLYVLKSIDYGYFIVSIDLVLAIELGLRSSITFVSFHSLKRYFRIFIAFEECAFQTVRYNASGLVMQYVF